MSYELTQDKSDWKGTDRRKSVLQVGQDDAVRVERGQDDENDPQENEDEGWGNFDEPRSAEFTASKTFLSLEDEDGDGHDGLDAEDGHGEAEGADRDWKLEPVVRPVAGGYRPKRCSQTLGVQLGGGCVTVFNIIRHSFCWSFKA